MKRTMEIALDISSDDDDKPSSSNGTKDLVGGKRVKSETTVVNPAKKVITDELLTRSAKMYQKYMNQIPIPAQRASTIPFTSWTDLAKAMKRMYRQPLHYLTNVRLKELDRMRSSAGAKDAPLDAIIHPLKAETSIWLMEEVHRLTSSHQFLAKLWTADPMYQTCIDSVLPQL